MKQRKISSPRVPLGLIMLSAIVLAWVGLFTVLAAAEANLTGIEPVPVSGTQDLMVDVVTREHDLLRVTSNWPKSLTLENVSDKNVSGFQIEIFPNIDGAPLRYIGWGKMPGYGVQDPMLKPQETVTVAIKPEIVKTFQDYGQSFLYLQLETVWVDNDPTYKYESGSVLKQDPTNPKRYVVIEDAKGRKMGPDGHYIREPNKRQHSGMKHQHNHVVFPHITHSVKPPFVLGCCDKEFYQSVEWDCSSYDPCFTQPPPDTEHCYISTERILIAPLTLVVRSPR